jgi:DNA repair exonuclease SbcCD ATPase subunit
MQQLDGSVVSADQVAVLNKQIVELNQLNSQLKEELTLQQQKFSENGTVSSTDFERLQSELFNVNKKLADLQKQNSLLQERSTESMAQLRNSLEQAERTRQAALADSAESHSKLALSQHHLIEARNLVDSLRQELADASVNEHRLTEELRVVTVNEHRLIEELRVVTITVEQQVLQLAEKQEENDNLIVRLDRSMIAPVEQVAQHSAAPSSEPASGSGSNAALSELLRQLALSESRVHSIEEAENMARSECNKLREQIREQQSVITRLEVALTAADAKIIEAVAAQHKAIATSEELRVCLLADGMFFFRFVK